MMPEKRQRSKHRRNTLLKNPITCTISSCFSLTRFAGIILAPETVNNNFVLCTVKAKQMHQRTLSGFISSRTSLYLL